MERTKYLFLLPLFLLSAVLTNAQEKVSEQARQDNTRVLSGTDCDPEAGADAYASRGDNPHSAYYANPDFFRLASNDTLTILPHFRTMQQTTEWSCGCVAALLVLRHSDTETVKRAVGTTKLHKIIAVYKGVDMPVCEEI